jgi:hypothetical protein
MIDLFNKKKVAALQNLEKEFEQYREETGKQIQNLQIDILTTVQNGLKPQPKYEWNQYQLYESATEQIHGMYNGTEPWGISIGTLIDLRAAFIGGHGLEIDQVIPDTDREKAFVEEFLRFNNLNSAGFLRLLQDFQKEAKYLGVLIPDKKHEWTWMDGEKEVKEIGMVRIKYHSWKEYGYTVTEKKNTVDVAESVTYRTTEDTESKDVVYLEPQFVYRRSRGSPNKINETISVFHRCLENVKALEKALFDWRTNDHLFAAPKPIVECETKEQAEAVKEQLTDNTEQGLNFATRRVFVVTGRFIYAVPAQTVDLDKEISRHIKMISFHTGIPEQFLGDSSGVRGKDLSENLMEGVDHAMEGDRQVSIDMFNEMIQKAMSLMNGEKTSYKEKAIELRIGKITAADWNRIVAIWMPSNEAGQISRETLLEQYPGLDVKQELERLEKEGEENKKKQDENRDPLIDEMLSIDRAEKIEENKFKREAENGDIKAKE